MADSAINYNVNVQTQGVTPAGATTAIPLSGRVDGTSTPLVANATWQSKWIYVDQFIGVATTLYSDQPGSYVLDYSEDGTTVGPMPSVTIQYTLTGQSRKGSFGPSAKYVRFTYTNGATAQTKFVFNIDLNATQTQPSSETLNAVGADTRTATWTKTRVETKTSDATNDYAPIYRSGNALRVYVDNQTTSPVTQPVSGTVAVSNFPAIQPVSLATLPALAAGTNTVGAFNLVPNKPYRNVALTAAATVTGTILDVIDVYNPTNTLIYLHFYDGAYTSAKTPFWTKLLPGNSGIMQERLNLQSATTPSGIIGFIPSTVQPTATTTPITAPGTGIYVGLGYK